MKFNKNTRGFTLIEMIAAIALMGILAAFVSIGIAKVFEGYIFTRDNADTSLNAQIAMSRLMKEFSSIEAVTLGSGTAITYTYNKDGISIPDRRVSWSGVNTPLLLGGNVLTENVNDFALTYHTSHTDAGDNTWDGTEKMIGITLDLKGASNVVSSFSIRVVPRNL